MLNDIKKLNQQQQQQQVLLQTTTNSKIVNNIFFEYYYNTNENLIKIPSPSSSLPSTPLSIQSSKSISTTSSESINVNDQLNQQQNHHHQLEHNQLQQMFINAYTNEEYVCLDDIDILKPIHINCSYFNYNPVVNSAPIKRQSGLLKISNNNNTRIQLQERNRPSSVSTSSPSSCSYSSNSLSSSSLALVSPQQNQNNNFSAATPDTSNSSSATMIIRKSPPELPPPIRSSPIPAKTNLNYIFSQFDGSGGSYIRRTIPNYENDFISQHQSKRKISSLSPIMTSSRADLNTICNNNTPKKPSQLNFNFLSNNNKTPTTTTPKHQIKQLKSILLQNSTPVLNHKKFVSFKPHPYQIEFDYEEEEDVEVEEIELREEKDETIIQNAYSNDTYGILLSPKINDNYVELNKFIEENKQRVDRLRSKRIQTNNNRKSQNNNNSPFVCLV